MQCPCPPTLSFLLSAQNSDGGWGYGEGGSWAEPTAYALLAQAAAGTPSPSAAKGFEWLDKLERPDGGFPPRPSVDQSTWVTALVLLLHADGPESPAISRGLPWLLEQTGRESSFFYRLRLTLLGLKNDPEEVQGWPWFPNTAAWVSPTAIAILALGKIRKRKPSLQLEERIEAGQRFLLLRMCEDGGWNHGSARALGYEAGSYPETTGLALLALHGFDPRKLQKSYAAAARHLHACRSAQGLSWLRLGLQAHSRPAAVSAAPFAPCRNAMDVALWLLADAAEAGKNVFLE